MISDSKVSHIDPERCFDTLIVGNGALGLALGLELEKRGQRVGLIGPKQRFGSASAAAGAMNGCFGEVTSTLLSTSLGRTKHLLDIMASRVWDDWAAEIAEIANVPLTSLRQKSGTTVILNGIGTSEIDSANFRSIRCALDECKEPYSILEEGDIGWISPQASSRAFQAIHIPNEHSVQTPNYLNAIESAYVKYGGILVDSHLKKIESNSSTSSSLILDNNDKLTTNTIVLAAGAHSWELLNNGFPEIGSLVPPMVSGCGVSVLIHKIKARPMSGVIRTPNRAFACGLHAVPRPNGIYLGATNIFSNQPQISPMVSDLQFLLDCGMKQLHTSLATGRIQAVQLGNRPVPIDGFPLIGVLPDPKIWMMTGTYRDGFHQSPLLAQLLARAICKEGSADDILSVFSPVRQPVQTGSRQKIVSAAVEHTIATGFESDWRIPAKWGPRIKADLHLKFDSAANQIHSHLTPPSEMLAFSIDNPWLLARIRKYYAAHGL